MKHITLDDNLLVVEESQELIKPWMIKSFTEPIVFSIDAANNISDTISENMYNFKVSYPYVCIEQSKFDTFDDSILFAANILGMTGYISFKRVEEELLTEKSQPVKSFYDTKYCTPKIMGIMQQDYGSPIHIAKATIKNDRLRNDKREFGLKYAKNGIYENLIYFDFHNFYPNIMMEIGCPNRLDSDKIKLLLDSSKCKGFLNTLIGRFDADYSLFYDPIYANNLRRFGRAKLLYYIDQCKELILCNTDSILAKVSDEFETPDNVTYYKVKNALIHNIGNYVLYSKGTDPVRRGIFHKPEEYVIAKYRMGLNPSNDEFKLSSLFGTDEEGYISADTTEIINIDRKCKYGKSNYLFTESLARIQSLL